MDRTRSETAPPLSMLPWVGLVLSSRLLMGIWKGTGEKGRKGQQLFWEENARRTKKKVIDLKLIPQLACNAVPPLVKLQDLKLKIRRVRCLQMYPLRVRTWCKGQNSNETTNDAPIDLKIIPQLACNAVPPLVKLQDSKRNWKFEEYDAFKCTLFEWGLGANIKIPMRISVWESCYDSKNYFHITPRLPEPWIGRKRALERLNGRLVMKEVSE